MPQAPSRANKAIKPLRAARMEPRKSSQRPSTTECTGQLRPPGSKEQTDGRINYLYSKKPADMTRAEYDDICKRMDDTARELRNGGNRQ